MSKKKPGNWDRLLKTLPPRKEEPKRREVRDPIPEVFTKKIKWKDPFP